MKITYAANYSTKKNRTRLMLLSPDGLTGDTIELVQAARVVVPLGYTIDPTRKFQTISGFGGAAIWNSESLSATEVKEIFGSDESDLGLSIVRVRIAQEQSSWVSLATILKEIVKYDVKIIASPWSPPASLKDNNNNVDGHLLPENYGAYAQHLNEFVTYMASQGVPIYAVSIQNEPDIEVKYESCRWTPAQLLSFVQNHARTIQNTKVVASESFNFNKVYTDPLLNDATAVGNFDIVGGHIYGGGLSAHSLAEQKGKEVWMTEYLMNLSEKWVTAESTIWNESVEMLQSMHTAMSYNWNAYIWWYIRRYYSFLGDGDKSTTAGATLKRGHAFAHFAKFVRPGYTRIHATADKSSELKVTAYEGDGQTIIVVVNPSVVDVSNVKWMFPVDVTSVTAYVTSLTQNRDKSEVTPSGNAFSASFPAKSVTTFVVK
ncbi:MAG: cellulose-binding protein [Marinilabiliaceae bacterium]|nr:cellulose-binding protein [Marinilabiliaceae bacterium]